MVSGWNGSSGSSTCHSSRKQVPHDSYRLLYKVGCGYCSKRQECIFSGQLFILGMGCVYSVPTVYATIMPLNYTCAIQVFCTYGCPNVIISDQGREFVNKITEELFLRTNTEQRITSPYHPQVRRYSKFVHY